MSARLAKFVEKVLISPEVSRCVEHDAAVVDEPDRLRQRLRGGPGQRISAVEEALQVGATVGERRAELVDHRREVALVDRLDGAVEVQQQGVDAQRVAGVLAGITSPSASTSPPSVRG